MAVGSIPQQVGVGSSDIAVGARGATPFVGRGDCRARRPLSPPTAGGRLIPAAGLRPRVTTETPGAADGDWRRRLDDVHDALSGKWTPHVLRALANGPAGFGRLREATGAPEKSLARRLRDLRCRGLVAAEHVPDSPPRRRYRLTAEGERVAALFRGVEREVSYVECTTCEEDCRVATLNPATTRRAMAEEC